MSEAERDPDPKTLEDWLRHAAAESIVWPVLIVVALVAVTIGAGVLRIAIADRNFAAIAALVVLLWMSVDIVRQDRRAVRESEDGEHAGLVSRLVVGWWAASAIAAVALPFLY